MKWCTLKVREIGDGVLVYYIKAFHIISVISWFAGLIYLGRLFIYHQEAIGKDSLSQKAVQSQLLLMAKRVWHIICIPAMVLSVFFGGWLAILIGAFSQPWFHMKLSLVFGLLVYHFFCGKFRNDLVQNRCSLTEKQFRIFNEILTLFLVMIVFITVTKSLVDMVLGTFILGGSVFCVILFIKFISMFKKR